MMTSRRDLQLFAFEGHAWLLERTVPASSSLSGELSGDGRLAAALCCPPGLLLAES